MFERNTTAGIYASSAFAGRRRLVEYQKPLYKRHKIDADANRYTFVWGKAIKTSKERIKKQPDELWQYAQNVAASELPDRDLTDFDKTDAETLQTILCFLVNQKFR